VGALTGLIWLMTDRLEVLVNAVMNLWVTFLGRTPLYEVSFLPLLEILLRSVHISSQGTVNLPQSG